MLKHAGSFEEGGGRDSRHFRPQAGAIWLDRLHSVILSRTPIRILNPWTLDDEVRYNNEQEKMMHFYFLDSARRVQKLLKSRDMAAHMHATRPPSSRRAVGVLITYCLQRGAHFGRAFTHHVS